jgi:hypothetical protein
MNTASDMHEFFLIFIKPYNIYYLYLSVEKLKNRDYMIHLRSSHS